MVEGCLLDEVELPAERGREADEETQEENCQIQRFPGEGPVLLLFS